MFRRKETARGQNERVAEEVAALRQQLAESESRVAQLEADNAGLQADNAELRQRLEDLERRLGLDSSTSSKRPPATGCASRRPGGGQAVCAASRKGSPAGNRGTRARPCAKRPRRTMSRSRSRWKRPSTAPTPAAAGSAAARRGPRSRRE